MKDTKIGRLDLDLFRLDTVLPDWGVLQKKYGRYWDTYTIGVLQLGRASDSNFSNLLALFLKDPVPSAIGLAGIAIIVAGMTGNSLCQ